MRRDRRSPGFGLVACALVALIVIGACAPQAPTTPAGRVDTAPKVLRFPLFEPTTPIDPNRVADFTTVYTFQLWEGLYRYQGDGKYTPAQAESFTVSADKLTYTFKLRSGLKWSDGSPLTAKDYEYSWKRAADPTTASQYAFATYSIKGAKEFNKGQNKDAGSMAVRATSDTALEVTLASPAAYFIPLIATWTFMPTPRAAIEKHGDKWVEPGNIVNNGPYTIQSWKHDQEMVMVPNTSYQGNLKPAVDRIEVKILPEYVTGGLRAYENDELDWAEAPVSEYERLKAKFTNEVVVQPLLRPRFLSFDVRQKPFNDVRVRQAFSMSVEREALINGVFKGIYKPMRTVIPSQLLGSDESAGLKEDIARAKALLAEAGYPDGKGFPEFAWTGKAEPQDQLLGAALQQMWKKNLGIDSMKINLIEVKAFAQFVNSRATQPFGIISGGWAADYADPANYFNDLFRSGNQYWQQNWVNPEYDRLVDLGKAELDEGKRRDLYVQANKILATELPSLPLWIDGKILLRKAKISPDMTFEASGKWPIFATIKFR